MSLRRLVFHATPTRPLGLDDLVEPVAQRRASNRRRGLHALSVYAADHLFEVVEGGDAGVDAYMDDMRGSALFWGLDIVLDHVVETGVLRHALDLIYVPGDEEIPALGALQRALLGGGDCGMWLSALEDLVWRDSSSRHPGLAQSDSSAGRPAIRPRYGSGG